MPRAKSRGRVAKDPLLNRIKIRRHNKSRSKSPTRRQSLSLFSSFDKDGNGTISFDELCSALRDLSHLSPSGEVEWDDETVRLMLEQADADGDGEIDEKEFLRMMDKVESGAMSLHYNWYTLSATAAEKTISDTHKQVNSSFDRASNYVRGTLATPDTGKVSMSHKIIAVCIDVLYAVVTYFSLLFLAKSWDQMDFNTLIPILEAVGADRDEASSMFDSLLSHIGEDVADGMQLTVTATITSVLIGLALFSFFLRGQTIGQMFMSHQPVRAADETHVPWTTSLIYIVLSIITLDPLTGLASSIMGLNVMFRSAATTSSSSSSVTTHGLNIGLSKNSLANMCNQPFSKRPLSDPIWLVVYLSLTYFILTEGHDGGESLVKTLISKFNEWGPYARILTSIPNVASEHPSVIGISLLVMIASTTAFLMIARQFLRPLLYAMVVGWACTTLYTVVEAPSMALTMMPSLFALRYLWHYRSSFELQIAIYQEAIVATIVHPLLPLIVPIMEAIFYLFQLEMTTRYAALEINNWTSWGKNDQFQNNERLALWAMRIYIPWTLQSGRALFEMICSSVIGRYYYRKALEDQSILKSNHVSRTIHGVTGVVLKSTGTAIGFGFAGMMIGFLQKFHSKLCESYSKLNILNPLHWIPIAIMFILKYTIAMIIFYFEVMHRNGVTYAGMTGETMLESAKRAQGVIATDGALVLTEHSGTGKLSAICVSASAALAIGIMHYGWEPLKNNVPSFNPSNTYDENHLYGICIVVMLSMATSTIQVLSRAANTIMICALDEIAYDSKIRHASDTLKYQINRYMNEKSSFPSTIWSLFIMLLFAGACSGLEYLNLSKQIDDQQHIASVVVSCVIAIFL